MERGTEKRGIREEVKERRGGRRQVEENSRVNCNNNSMKCIQLKNKSQCNSLGVDAKAERKLVLQVTEATKCSLLYYCYISICDFKTLQCKFISFSIEMQLVLEGCLLVMHCHENWIWILAATSANISVCSVPGTLLMLNCRF